ncbi:hypothetical protein BP6252_06848 [Coleophoma cylindrospora]|uniref:Zn(2)-C6 fungal-type domain-containing protein n=1 Tax=Coleophoma cylindrospora TaxID=1849047 RepID=A0A3D8RGF0_9HELO|nr:hypothetical protein BP6252_06848 [Coleophoma cylindrospora]
MSGMPGPNDTPRRRIKIETRFGSARQSRSRKDRPCDLCRGRKSACVITTKPPCRLCKTRGLDCTFTTEPARRGQPVKSPSTSSPAVSTTSLPEPVPIPVPAFGREEPAEESDPASKASDSQPQVPDPPAPRRHSNDFNTNPFLVPTHTSTSKALPEAAKPILPDRLSPATSFTSPQRYYYPSPQSANTSVISNYAESSLEDGDGLTAHFIGLSGEQDTDLLASIRYNVLNESSFVDFNVRKVFSGISAPPLAPIHFSMLHDAFPERDQRAKRLASDAIEQHVRGFGDALLRLYFQFVHPVFPILSKARTLRSYVNDKLSLPASLRGAIYGLACAFWDQDPTLKGIPRITQPELFEYAHAALNRELDSPKLSTLQACLLVMHEQPEITGTTESPRLWAYACQATACAQSLGLHQDPSMWKLPLWEKRLRKKLWWATYLTDKWTSICHGNPPHIPLNSFDTPELSLDDMSEDEDVIGLPGWSLLSEQDRTCNKDDGAQFLEMVHMSKLLDDVLRTSFTLEAYSHTICKTDQEQRAVIRDLKRHIDGRMTILLDCLAVEGVSSQRLPGNGQLHLAIHYFAIKHLTLRALMSPATSAAKANPGSRLCENFSEALSEGHIFVDFISKLRMTDIRVFWSRHCRTNLIHSGNFLIYLFFCASTEKQVKEAYDILQVFRADLRFMADNADWRTIGLLRPVLLRAESFFQGAAKGIRDAGTE